MNKLFSDFPKISKEKWEEKLTKELKGADFESSFMRTDEIEDLFYSTYSHHQDAPLSVEVPGAYPFTRSGKTTNNDWNIASLVVITDEKEANIRALDFLMTGCTSLIFESRKNTINWEILFDQIGFEYIQTQFILTDFEQYTSLRKSLEGKENCVFSYRLDFFFTEKWMSNFTNFIQVPSSETPRFCHVNTFEIQQCGASISQEVSFGLAVGHEYLVKLMENGYTIDQASSSIHFSIGVGANYFYEMAKVRALRKLWSKIVKSYNPKNENSAICPITAEIGHMNKSLKDPYTNLLRQTTEAMSAVSAGVDTLLIHPYNSKSTEGTTELAARMAMNISLILKDESYFDMVIDPIGGSYSIELLTEQIAEKSWRLFQEIDTAGGICSKEAVDVLKEKILDKAKIRLEKVKSGQQVIIGVNKFPNPEVEENSWIPEESFLGLKKIVFERDLKINLKVN